MKYRTLPGADFRVSEVGFGCWTTTTTWWGITDDAYGIRLMQQAFDLGINFFDTADTYGNGKGETLLAEAFKGKRDKLVIATKFGYDFYTNPNKREGQKELPQDTSPAFVRHALEQTLRRLDTDYVDIYNFHNIKMPIVENEELFALLEQLKQEGKIRAYGVAIGPAIGWRDEGVRCIEKYPKLQVVHMIHNLLEMDPGRAFLEAGRKRPEKNVGYLARVPHSSGMLEGKYDENTTFAPGDHRNHRRKDWLVNGLKKVSQLDFLTEGCDLTIGQAAIKWLLAEPLICSVLPNIYNEEQLAEFAAAPEKADLTAADLAKLAELYDTNYGLTAVPAEENVHLAETSTKG